MVSAKDLIDKSAIYSGCFLTDTYRHPHVCSFNAIAMCYTGIYFPFFPPIAVIQDDGRTTRRAVPDGDGADFGGLAEGVCRHRSHIYQLSTRLYGFVCVDEEANC